MKLFTGSGVALVTPFNDNGVDFDKLEELIEYHIKNDTDAIIICGTTGEATTMTEEEKKSTIKFTVEKANGRIPIIAGSGSNNTATAIQKIPALPRVDAATIILSKTGLCIFCSACKNSNSHSIVNIPLIYF